MIAEIEKMLDSYDKGSLSRRQLVAGLATVAAWPAGAQAQSTLRAVSLNHVTLSVADVERSRQFYERLFGMQVVSKQAGGINVAAGPGSFVGLFKISGSPGINHFCLSAENFQVEAAVKTLEQQGVKSRVRDRDGVKELYLQDPDGITVQVQEKGYRG